MYRKVEPFSPDSAEPSDTLKRIHAECPRIQTPDLIHPWTLSDDAFEILRNKKNEMGLRKELPVRRKSCSKENDVAERHLRILEALLFASTEPLATSALSEFLGEGADAEGLLNLLAERYADRGVNLVKRGDKWAFRTADDLGFLLRREQVESKNLSRAALETLAIIAYHQPTTRAEVEEVRGVATGKGTREAFGELFFETFTVPLERANPLQCGLRAGLGADSKHQLERAEPVRWPDHIKDRQKPHLRPQRTEDAEQQQGAQA